MSKRGIVVSARSGGRLDKAALSEIKARFLSTGKFEGTEKFACEILQLCIDKGYPFSFAYSCTDQPSTVSITRG